MTTRLPCLLTEPDAADDEILATGAMDELLRPGASWCVRIGTLSSESAESRLGRFAMLRNSDTWIFQGVARRGLPLGALSPNAKSQSSQNQNQLGPRARE